MESFNQFKNIVESRHDVAVKWKNSTGGKVFGQFCRYVPEEIVHAGGGLPVFVLGQMGEFGNVDKFVQENTCPYMRSCFAAGLAGEYDYLDGLVVTHACDMMAKMHDFWRNRTRVASVFLLDFPHKINESSLIYFRNVLDRFRGYVEETLKTEITDGALKESIQIYNEYRRLLRELYGLRRRDPSPISGLEIHTVVLATLLVRKEAAIPLLNDLLKEVEERRDSRLSGVPILVSGTDVDNLVLYSFLEDCGAAIVADDVCTGSRYFWKPVDEKLKPMDALAERYLTNIPCSRTSPSEERYAHIQELAREFKAKGVIMPIMDFCDAHMFDAPYVLEKLNERGFPTLKIEIDYTKGGLEQLRPNVEAFLEIISGEE